MTSLQKCRHLDKACDKRFECFEDSQDQAAPDCFDGLQMTDMCTRGEHRTAARRSDGTNLSHTIQRCDLALSLSLGVEGSLSVHGWHSPPLALRALLVRCQSREHGEDEATKSSTTQRYPRDGEI